ncbi:hypothetical protein ACFY36_41910 [Actinoplanes sp. NPDC000266]
MDPEWPVLLLSEDLSVIQIVAPATEAEKQGYTLLSPSEAEHASPTGLAGIEVPLGLPQPGVIRVALPHENHIFCTWQTTLTPDALTGYVCTLPPAKFREVELALRLSGSPRPTP